MKVIKSVKSMKKSTKITVSAFVIVLLFLAGTLAFNISRNENIFSESQVIQQSEAIKEQTIKQAEEQPTQTPAPEEKPAPETTIWPVIYTMEQASGLTVVVNKKHKLPSDYVPVLTSVSGASMRPEAAESLEKLLTDAQNASVPMKVLSSYRSYSNQLSTYNRWVSQSGQATADTFSARPGHSEHQLGLAVDLGESNTGACDLETCFGNTPAGQWLASNAQNYGFIIRYPSGKQTETGYQYEPWHLRYVGTEVAIAINNSGQTLDQYYGVEAGGY